MSHLFIYQYLFLKKENPLEIMYDIFIKPPENRNIKRRHERKVDQNAIVETF